MIPVGHRALVAIERSDGGYDCYYAHDGAREWRLCAPLTATREERNRRTARRVDGVDPAPIVTDVSFETVVDAHVDFCTHEACYRVDRDRVRPFHVCWFGFPTVGEQCPDTGALVAVDAADARADGALVRGWCTGTKAALAGVIDSGRLSADAARDCLRTRLRDWAGGREVVDTDAA